MFRVLVLVPSLNGNAGAAGKSKSMFNCRFETETIEVHALRRHENCY